VFRSTCLVAIAFAIGACAGSDSPTNVSGPPASDLARASKATPFTRVDLGTLGGQSSYAAAINSDGVVVGWSETKSGETHAFRWAATTGMVDLGTIPGESSSQAVAILDGSLTSGPTILGVSGRNAVVWSTSASISVLPVTPSGASSSVYPQALNERGEVVGFDVGSGPQHAWIWSARDGRSDLSGASDVASNEASASAITSQGVALLTSNAGTCRRSTQCWRTFLWTRASGVQGLGLPGNDSEADVTGLALNEDRTVVGWTTKAAGITAYRWTTTGGFTVLPSYTSSTYAYAAGVNAYGSAVGAALEPTSGSIIATLWPATGGVVRLSPEDGSPSVALAVNRSGTIAGWASVAGGVNHAVIWVPSTQSNRQMTPAGVVISSASSHSDQRKSSPSRSSSCLNQMRLLRTRQGLFTCVMAADRAGLAH